MSYDLVNFAIRALEPDATGFERQTAHAVLTTYRDRFCKQLDALESVGAALNAISARSTHFYNPATDSVERIRA